MFILKKPILRGRIGLSFRTVGQFALHVFGLGSFCPILTSSLPAMYC